jgi:hypothetical protein
VALFPECGLLEVNMKTPNAVGSSLQKYMQDYGQRLQSALDPASVVTMDQPGSALDPSLAAASAKGIQDTQLELQKSGAAQHESALMEPEEQVPTAEAAPKPPAPVGGSPSPTTPPAPQEQKAPAGEGTSFRGLVSKMPKKEVKETVDDLEKQLATANVSIDQAYDQLLTQLGSRPEAQKKLTREEKGMLIMEFGLSMMSAGNGGDSDGLNQIGRAGSQTLQSYRKMTRDDPLAKQQAYDQNVMAIQADRTKTKSKLAGDALLEEGRDRRSFATQSALDDRAAARDTAAETRARIMAGAGIQRTRMAEEGRDRRRYPAPKPGMTEQELRAQARRFANQEFQSSNDLYRGMDPLQVQELIDARAESIYEELSTAAPSSALEDSAPAKGPSGRKTRRAPAHIEADVRANPGRLDDFIKEFGYTPSGISAQ